MRLKHIKIAGFKSFVDPTTLVLPENMTCIVGPNGCGKSNTIDAVRWVMGESSAKHLRGDAKTDVIFAGSTTRKPVSQASVELLFDNSENRIVGEYAQYAEIAVKRVVTRDGQSQYYLNNIKCRRRDVTELFLGTGLGPRSYAIIEQGMISNLIMAKPEELRHFLEEAAGISKYKERRRETELRMTRTRENLERLYDIREELGRQLKRLEKQAADANIFKALQAEKRQKQIELNWLRFIKVRDVKSTLDTKVRQEEVSLESAYTQRREAETAIEEFKLKAQQAQDEFYEKQQTFYQVGTAITKLEEAQKHHALRRSGLESEQAQVDQALQTLQSHQAEDNDRRAALQAELNEYEPELEVLEDRIEAAQERFDAAQEAYQDWQDQWQEYVSGSAAPSQASQVAQVTIVQHEKSMSRWVDKKDTLQAELDALSATQELAEIDGLKARRQVLLVQAQERSESVRQLSEQMFEAEKTWTATQQTQREARASLDQAQGRYASLSEVHEKTLNIDDDAQQKWLTQESVEDKRLAQLLEVDREWQLAVEALLGPLLTGIVVDEVRDYWLVQPCPQKTFLLSNTSNEHAACFPAVVNSQGLVRLLDVVRFKSPVSLPGWLTHVYLAETDQAVALVNTLESHESVLTPNGQWLGSGWGCYGLGDGVPGLLVLQHDLDELTRHMQQCEKELVVLDEQSGLQQQELQGYRDQIATIHDDHSLQQEQDQVGRTLSGLEAKAEQVALRRQRLDADLAECEKNIETDWRQLQESRKSLEIAVESMASYEDTRIQLESGQESVQQTLQMCRDSLTQDQDRARALSELIKFSSASLEALDRQLDRANEAQAQHKARLLELTQSMSTVVEEAVSVEALPALLQAQQEAEQQKTQAKDVVEHFQHCLKTQEDYKNTAERSIDRLRTVLEGLRIKVQAEQSQIGHLLQELEQQGVKTQRTLQFDEQQLDEQQNGETSIEHQSTGLKQDDIELSLPEGANEHAWVQAIAVLEKKVGNLGAINLAAVDEFDAQSERKNYMDEQYADLESALFTLETAIEQIDHETRERFQVTFLQINEGMGQLFPRLFGGGQAKLELVGDDILTAGVAIMARPPGKKNTSIHMLSGGEKALTAISLVFAIFQLNPSPFCMLDEVDAPLDDANVGRYADMVKHMSEKVQFIYISHNKIAMEKASQLMGVTMQEPGVSRLVSVDIGEASALAAL